MCACGFAVPPQAVAMCQSIANVHDAIAKEAVKAYTHVVVGMSALQTVINDIACKIFKGINDVLQNTDPTKTLLQVGMAIVDGCDLLGAPVAVCKSMMASLKSVTSFISAKSVFQKLNAFATTSVPFVHGYLDVAKSAKVVSTASFAISDGITFAKWCSDNKLIGSQWYTRSISVLDCDLKATPEQIQNGTALVGFSTTLAATIYDVYNRRGFTPKTTCEFLSSTGKIVANLLRPSKDFRAKLMVVGANFVSSVASLVLFFIKGQTPPPPPGGGGAGIPVPPLPAHGDGPDDPKGKLSPQSQTIALVTTLEKNEHAALAASL